VVAIYCFSGQSSGSPEKQKGQIDDAETDLLAINNFIFNVTVHYIPTTDYPSGGCLRQGGQFHRNEGAVCLE